MQFWDKMELGSPIPELIKKPDHRQIFMYSAITWNRHMIHYNRQTAREEGHKDVVVQRALLGSYLAQLITDWLCENGQLRRLEWKVVKSAYPGDVLACKGEVAEKTLLKDKRRLSCKLHIENQHEETIVVGKALVQIG